MDALGYDNNAGNSARPAPGRGKGERAFPPTHVEAGSEISPVIDGVTEYKATYGA